MKVPEPVTRGIMLLTAVFFFYPLSWACAAWAAVGKDE